MVVALAVSIAAYAALALVASNLWPLLDPARAREFEVQLLPTPSATARALTPPELADAPADWRAPAPQHTPPRELRHDTQVHTATPATQAQLDTVNAPPLADATPVTVNAPPLADATPAAVKAPPDATPAVNAPPLADTARAADTVLVATAPFDSAAGSRIDNATRPGSATPRTVAAEGPASLPLPSPQNSEEIMPFGPGMTPPRLLRGQAPKYTAPALAARIEGKVIVRCVLTASGEVRTCRVVKPLAELDRAAVRSLEASRFTPVTFQGRPTAVSYLFSFDFRLP